MDITTRNIEQCDAPSVLAAVLDAHDHPQKIDQIAAAISPIAAAAAAYSEGKPQLAQAITNKGVTTAADASLATMAQNVSAIIQQQTIISGGDAYKQQLFSDADPTKAVLWDLYQVLAQMKTLYLSGESAYTGLLVCEYDKSLDAVDLDKASAWVCSDMVDKTTPILSTDDTHHVWNDANDGKANRWICFLYTNSAGGTFTITSSDAALSPLSIYVGGHINTIEYQTNGKLTELVSGLTENDYVDNFLNGGYTQDFGFNAILRNVKKGQKVVVGSKGTFVLRGIVNLTNGGYNNYAFIANSAKTINLGDVEVFAGGLQFMGCRELLAPKLKTFSSGMGNLANNDYLNRIYIPSLTSSSGYENLYIVNDRNVIDIEVGELTTSCNIRYWNPTTVINDSTKLAILITNIRNHILAKVSDRSSLGTSNYLTFTVSTNMYNAIVAADTDLEADFLAKGWYLAGA